MAATASELAGSKRPVQETLKSGAEWVTVILVGPPDENDLSIRRAISNTWMQNTLYRAPNIDAAFRTLTTDTPNARPVYPDLLIMKIPEPDNIKKQDIRRMRQYRLFRDVPIAALVEQDSSARLRCLRESGLNLVLTHEKLETQLLDIIDAVVDFWLKSYCDDCSARYFCRATEKCIMV